MINLSYHFFFFCENKRRILRTIEEIVVDFSGFCALKYNLELEI